MQPREKLTVREVAAEKMFMAKLTDGFIVKSSFILACSTNW